MAKKYNVNIQPDFSPTVKTNVCITSQSLKELKDVQIGTDLSDGFVLVYDSILQKWIAEELSISVDGGVY